MYFIIFLLLLIGDRKALSLEVIFVIWVIEVLISKSVFLINRIEWDIRFFEILIGVRVFLIYLIIFKILRDVFV